jgi:hypothetical protein
MAKGRTRAKDSGRNDAVMNPLLFAFLPILRDLGPT